MFAKTTKRFAAGAHRDASGGMPSIIGPDMVIHGNFKSGGELHIEGTVEGDIHVKALTVGKEATIRGEVTADRVRVCGTINGCVRAHEVVLMAGARVLGDVHHEILSIEPGASLEGHCRRRDGAKPEATREARPAVFGADPVSLSSKASAEMPAGASQPVAKAS